MPEKKDQKTKSDERPQRERFEEAARETEADQTGEEFEKAFRKIVRVQEETPPE